ncbi:MAG TPA: VCBS repeat-containing protein [Gemmataceae bacterium]|nr:VCBS repeat-containing protein [Gemmataceae bacterium]
MKANLSACLAVPALFLLALASWNTSAGEAPPPFVSFRMQELDEKLDIGYAVKCVDVNGDGKKDIVVVDSKRVIWLENPTWKVHTIIKGLTKPDNVCIDAYDVDGDGKLDFALGAGWKGPAASNDNSTLQWLKRGKDLDEDWTVYPIDLEPTVHRIRFADIDGNGKAALISVPLVGRGATAKNNWTDGSPVRVTAYRIPADPTKDRWVPEVLDETLHTTHNFEPIDAVGRKGKDVLVASYEGVNLLSLSAGKWTKRHLGVGNQDNPKSNRGASEIKYGKLKNGTRFIATIEPWHGNQVVVYTEPADKTGLWDRHVLDDHLRWGHGVSCADLDGDGNDEIVIGIRDVPNKTDKFTESRGVRVYKATDANGTKWQRQILDNGGVAAEDIATADLDGDGKLDIVAVGRQTHNIRIYWNQTKK